MVAKCECGSELVSSDFGHYCDNKECEHYDVDVLANEGFKIFEIENVQEEIEAFKRVEAKERVNEWISVV